ncbi:OmpH family outer membrane protein [Flammeovirgaceae bacterium SG7u.111]|nr:OmpH family outer membrane protein [Flammeovirgaceae bacterium SG7u.132]WPO33448.1 OmpH family outer membrane protein [Flammeovirgaceae bacterium SG7u.111]
MMPKNIKILVLAMMFPALGFSQKFGYMDSRAIVSQLPEYQQAETELQNLASGWKKELEDKQAEITVLREEFQAKEVLDTREKREELLLKIREKELEFKQLNQKYFGYQGLLFLKRQELVIPLQEKVLKAVETVGRKNRLEYVFDKASSVVIIYANPIHNYTELILTTLLPKEEEEEDYDPREQEEFKPEPADRSGYINTETIIAKMPGFLDVNAEMEGLEKLWIAQIAEKQSSLDSMKLAYEEEKVLLTKELRDEQEKLILEKVNELCEFKNERFGPEGLIYSRRQELMKPLQEKIFEATEKVANEKAVDFIFDKVGDVTMIYANPVHDYTDYVLEQLELGDPADVVK